MYLLISILFFLIIPHTGLFRYNLQQYRTLPLIGDKPARMVDAELARTGEPSMAYAKRFDETIAGHKKSMMLFLVPIFALGMIPLFPRRAFGEHLVFSTHYFAALLIHLGVFVQVFFKLALAALRALVPIAPGFAVDAANLLETEATLLLFIILPAIVYLAIASKRAYGVSRRRALVAAGFLSFWQIILFVYFYRAPLFFTTFYSLKYFN